VTNGDQRSVLRHFRALCEVGVARDLTDGQLLERFSTTRGSTGDLAFEALVERHGPLVWRACRSRLSNTEDAHDAFQATFLILLRKAPSLWVKDSLAPWLHQVALRTARRASLSAARRQQLHIDAADHLTRRAEVNPPSLDDRERVLHAEIDRLPEHQRVAILLCDLQGQSCEQAARAMGRPVGTIKSWRSRGRDRLRVRLTRAGLAPEADLGFPLAAGLTARGLVATQTDHAVRAAIRAFTDQGIRGSANVAISDLVQGVIKTMLFARLRKTALASLTLLAFTGGLGIVARIAAGEGKSIALPPTILAVLDDRVVKAAPPTAEATWPMTLHDAIRIGLDNNDEKIGLIWVPIDRPDGSIQIVAGDDIPPSEFKTQVMAHVREIGQQYWALWGVHEHQRIREMAVTLGEELLKREQAALDAGRGTMANVAEIRQQIERYRLKLVRTTTDVGTVDRQFRKILGLRAADARKIVPTTMPSETLDTLNPVEAVSQLMRSQPEIVKQVEELRQAEANPSDRSAIAAHTKILNQLVDQSTLNLDRFALDLEANYRQFRNAAKQRKAANDRLESEREMYEKGRILIDHYLDAISQYTNAITNEVQSRASYNMTMVHVNEAKGTLLETERIVIEFLQDRSPSPLDTKLRPASAPQSTAPASSNNQSRKDIEPAERRSQKPSDRTYTFHFSLGSGPDPIEFRGSLTLPPKE
jgi:RNA polymerase sigma factor (sigma-70 family)